MYLNDSEKKAIAKVLLEIMNADGEVVTAESLAMLNMQENLDITMEQVMAAKSLNAYTCLSTISKMSAENKAIVAVAMHRMIMADGRIDPEEVKVFNTVCELGNIKFDF